ncbi:coiled-coil domain-containing protein 15 [Boleophthalmus pectinirostris]|uniref:coiled-coil domain-containing protein 15 n=1 Tax=Boleophthalmus pectinirostris TaxID=150288 RepID=UPI00242C5DEE|nr:coiled-coil domain-containing protein 15 [Boleophthalmus pectinirostris]
MQRRMFLSKDRQNVKENREHQQHLHKTAGLKQQKERWRLEEERRLEEDLLRSKALESLEQREHQVLHTLSQEGAAQDGGRRRHAHLPKSTRSHSETSHLPKSTRQMMVLRSQVESLFPRSGPDPPPLCSCASFWESHPDTCANNCVFHNNPEALVQALRTVLHCWDLL